VGFGLLLVALPAFAAPGNVREARVQTHVDLPGFSFPAILADSSLRCFSGADFALVNPGCFVTGDPTQPGDCASTSSHFFVQYLFPDFAIAQRLRGFGFLNNDGDTVFPSAGALVLPLNNGSTRFPTAQELASLPARNVQASGDTSQVFVDLSGSSLVIEPGSAVALVLVLQFPDGGQLQAPTQGPGIAADRSLPDESCDYFTVDAGQSGVWFEPRYDPADPQSLPLDWGFVTIFDPVGVGVEDLTWSHVKQMYRTP
jgi:hypothetical protein